MMYKDYHYRATGNRRWKYELLRNVEIEITQDVQQWMDAAFKSRLFSVHIQFKTGEAPRVFITAYAGYAWDGFTCWRDIERALIASLMHDVARQAIDEGLMKPDMLPVSDRLFLKLLWRCSIPSWRAKLMYYAVVAFRKVKGWAK